MRRSFLLAFLIALPLLWVSTTAASAGCLPTTVTDDSYIGTGDGNDAFGVDAGMVCCETLSLSQYPGEISDVNVLMALTHSAIGDQVIKVKSPAGTVSAFQSRAGYAESADDGSSCCDGSFANWSGLEVRYDEQAGGPSAGTMGSGLTENEAVCTDDGICAFTPASGSAVGSGLDDDFDEETYAGTWTICVGDAQGGNVGTWDSFILELEVDRSIPCRCTGRFQGGDRVRLLSTTPPSGAEPDLNASGNSVAGGGTSAPSLGTEGEVMCGSLAAIPLLVGWDYANGHDGNGDFCTCPIGDPAIDRDLPQGTNSAGGSTARTSNSCSRSRTTSRPAT